MRCDAASAAVAAPARRAWAAWPHRCCARCCCGTSGALSEFRTLLEPGSALCACAVVCRARFGASDAVPGSDTPIRQGTCPHTPALLCACAVRHYSALQLRQWQSHTSGSMFLAVSCLMTGFCCEQCEVPRVCGHAPGYCHAEHFCEHFPMLFWYRICTSGRLPFRLTNALLAGAPRASTEGQHAERGQAACARQACARATASVRRRAAQQRRHTGKALWLARLTRRRCQPAVTVKWELCVCFRSSSSCVLAQVHISSNSQHACAWI